MRAALNSTLIALLLTAAPIYTTARAAAAPDVAGHWEGMAAGAFGSQSLGVDIARLPDQSLKGALSSDNLKGLALTSVSQSGEVVRFAVGGAINFEGHLDRDGKALVGSLITSAGEMGLTLTRDGEAEFEPVPVNGHVDARKEGVWEGALDVDGRHLRVRLTLANRTDGHADAVFASLDEGLDLPASVVENGAHLTLKARAVEGVWDGELNAAGDALVGSYAQRGLVIPLTMQRVAK